MVLLALWRVTAIFLTGGKSVKCSSLENLNTCKHTEAMPKFLNNSIVAENLLSQSCVIDAVQGARKTAEMSRMRGWRQSTLEVKRVRLKETECWKNKGNNHKVSPMCRISEVASPTLHIYL